MFMFIHIGHMIMFFIPSSPELLFWTELTIIAKVHCSNFYLYICYIGLQIGEATNDIHNTVCKFLCLICFLFYLLEQTLFKFLLTFKKTNHVGDATKTLHTSCFLALIIKEEPCIKVFIELMTFST